MSGDGRRLDRAAGVLTAAAAGDALGWPQEVRGRIVGGQRVRDQFVPQAQFRDWTRSAGSFLGGSRYHDPVHAGEYSDDTQLICATARACLRGDEWFDWLISVELPAWLIYQRGGGRAVLSAARSWASRTRPWSANSSAKQHQDRVVKYFEAGGNGAALRVAPHVLYAPNSLGSVLSRVFADGIATHGHPRAIVGAQMYAAALMAAYRADTTLEYGALIEGARSGLVAFSDVVEHFPESWLDSANASNGFATLWNSTAREAEQLLGLIDKSLSRGSLSDMEQTLRDIGCTDTKVSGAGTVTAAGAIYLASRFATQPMTGLLSGAFLRRADTDTLASMTGGLLGAIHGISWLDSLAEVQDANYLRELSEKLVSHSHVPPTRHRAVRPDDARDKLFSDFERGARAGTLPDGRRFELGSLEQLNGHRGAVWRARLRSDDGQTLIVDKVIRNAPSRVDFDVDRVAQLRNDEQAARSRPVLNGAVVLPVASLPRTIRFYSKALDLPIVANGRRASIAPWLTFEQVYGNVDHRENGVEIQLIVPSLSAAASRIGPLAHLRGESLYAVDPDGRRLRLTEAPDTAQGV